MPKLSSSDHRELADRLHSAAIHLLRRVSRRDSLTGVSRAQLSALSVLMSGPKTLGEIASAEQVRPPTVTRLVQALEARGLVARAADRRDRRVARVRLTAKGERVLGEGRDRRLEAVGEILSHLPASDLAALERAVTALERELGARHPPRRTTQ